MNRVQEQSSLPYVVPKRKRMYDKSLITRGTATRMWRHVKTKNIYSVLAVSICSTNGPGNGNEAVVYMNTEGEVFHRGVGEFLDGRFEPLDSAALKQLQ